MRVLCIIPKYLFPVLMQPSHALLPARSHPKAVGGMCYTIIKAHINMLCQNKIHIDRVKSIKSSSTNWGLRYKISWVIDKLSCHAMTHSQTKETRRAIPTCYAQTSYSSMQLANQKPDTLSQHASTYASYPSMQSAN